MVVRSVGHEPDRPEKVTPLAVLNGEPLFSLTAIAATVPGHRGNPHARASTLFRWITKGVRTATGEVVRLEAVRIGSSWRTSHEAVARFSARLTAAAAGTGSPVPVPASPAQRARNQATASAELDRILGCARSE